jgi:anti-anti-sigma factor
MEEKLECLEYDQVESVSVVKFKDAKVMDPSRIEMMGKELIRLCAEEDAQSVLINFENVSFFSSAAINKLIVLEKQVRARGGRICLSNLRPEVRDLFSYTSLDQLFEIRAEQQDGIEALQSEPKNAD